MKKTKFHYMKSVLKYFLNKNYFLVFALFFTACTKEENLPTYAMEDKFNYNYISIEKINLIPSSKIEIEELGLKDFENIESILISNKSGNISAFISGNELNYINNLFLPTVGEKLFLTVTYKSGRVFERKL